LHFTVFIINIDMILFGIVFIQHTFQHLYFLG